MSLSLPAHPNLTWLRNAAKDLLAELRERRPETKLFEAQLEIARRYGFASWRKLVAFVDAVDASGEDLRAAVRANDLAKVAAILDDAPDLVSAREDLPARERPSDEPRMSLLHLAVAEGHVAMATLLVDRGADLDARNHNGRTALHDCFELSRDDIGTLLIARGATVDVCAAAAYGDHARLEAILRADPSRANDPSTGLPPLGWASYAHDARAAEILIAHGAVVDGEAWGAACHVAALPVLHVLCAHGDPDAVDARGKTPLQQVIESNLVRDPTEAVRILLDAGADPRSALAAALAHDGDQVETYFPKRPLGRKQLAGAIELLRRRVDAIDNHE